MQTTVAVGAGGGVVRSDDHGETWTLADSGVDVDLRGVAFFDEQIVVAVGDEVVLRSDDAGQSWTRITVPAGLRAVVAMSAAVGYPPCRRARDEGGRPQRAAACAPCMSLARSRRSRRSSRCTVIARRVPELGL